MAIVRDLYPQYRSLFVLRNNATKCIVKVFFKRIQTQITARQKRWLDRIELCLITYAPTSQNITGEIIPIDEISRDRNAFDSPHQVAEFIRLQGFESPRDVIENSSLAYGLFADLKFFNVPSSLPSWITERVP